MVALPPPPPGPPGPRSVILHELIHGPTLVNGMDLSIRFLTRVAALKAARPQQVVLLLSNHELAQLHGEQVMKAGKSVTDAFDDGIDTLFPGEGEAEAVREAFNDYVRSLPLAVRLPNRVLVSHSLPAPRYIDTFDKTVLDRELTEEDRGFGGAAYQMVWGRHLNAKIATELAATWDVDWFLTGHQPADMGYEVQGDRVIILASNHEHGVALPVETAHPHDTLEAWEEAIVPLNAVTL